MSVPLLALIVALISSPKTNPRLAQEQKDKEKVEQVQQQEEKEKGAQETDREGQK